MQAHIPQSRIAEVAGVSTWTVNRFMNHHRVSPLSAQKIRDACATLDPNFEKTPEVVQGSVGEVVAKMQELLEPYATRELVISDVNDATNALRDDKVNSLDGRAPVDLRLDFFDPAGKWLGEASIFRQFKVNEKGIAISAHVLSVVRGARDGGRLADFPETSTILITCLGGEALPLLLFPRAS